MTTPTLRGSSSGVQATLTTSHSTSLPVTANANDYVVVLFSVHEDATVSSFDGLTELGNSAIWSGSSVGRTYLLYGRLSAGKTALNFTTSSSDTSVTLVYHFDPNANLVSSFDAVEGNSDSPDPPISSVTVIGDVYVFAACSWLGNYFLLTYPSGYTTEQITARVSTGGDPYLGAAAAIKVATSTHDPGVFGLVTTTRWLALSWQVEYSAFTPPPTTMTASGGSFTLTGNATSLTCTRSMAASAGSFTLTGNAAGVTSSRAVVAANAAFTLSGQAVTALAGRGLVVDAGSFALTGDAASLTAARTLSHGAGSFAFTGNDAALSIAKAIAVGSGSFSLAGNDAALAGNRTISASGAGFSLSGQASALTTQRTLPTSPASFTLDGVAVGTIAGRVIPIDPASFSFTGIAVGTGVPTLTAASGSVVLSGNDVGVVAGRVMTADGDLLMMNTTAVRDLNSLAADPGVFAAVLAPAVFTPSPPSSSWFKGGGTCNCGKCCKRLSCFNNYGLEWIEINGAVPGECSSWGCIDGRYYYEDSVQYTHPSEGTSPCFREWVQPPPSAMECVTGSAAAVLGGNVYLRRIFYVQLGYALGVRTIRVWLIEELYDHPAGPPASPHAFRNWLWHKTLAANETGVITLANWATTGPFQRGPNPDPFNMLDSLCDYPDTIKVKICGPVVCFPPSCKCWDETESAYSDIPRTAYLDVCGGTVLPHHSPYTGCSNGAYFLACGGVAGPCWSLVANCGTPYSFQFGCNVGGIAFPGGYLLLLDYTANSLIYRLVSYTNIDAGVTNTMLACELTGDASADTALITPPGCPPITVPLCGLNSLTQTVNYFTFPLGNINARTTKTYAEFLTLAASSYAPICDYTSAIVDLELV